ncbi:hypothetical protein IRJ41_006297 [Triplophysa rosa]|uniref:Uncharacterized protein n=1 Tax=Triplophysa rosa TaxID=992332 RepID=A0A9W7X2K0_TRIRA|nr:hypothetical protein IRJ41_006297 [Triplophysa rosa]
MTPPERLWVDSNWSETGTNDGAVGYHTIGHLHMTQIMCPYKTTRQRLFGTFLKAGGQPAKRGSRSSQFMYPSNRFAQNARNRRVAASRTLSLQTRVERCIKYQPMPLSKHNQLDIESITASPQIAPIPKRPPVWI